MLTFADDTVIYSGAGSRWRKTWRGGGLNWKEGFGNFDVTVLLMLVFYEAPVAP